MAALPKIYFERLLESSPDIVIAVDSDGKIVFYNDGAKRTLGYTAAELLGQPVTRVYPSLDEARAVMQALRSPRDRAGKVKNFETTLVAKNGERFPAAISGSIIEDDEGVEIGSIGFAKDLREIRLRDQVVTLAELFVSLSHEINNPLEAIGNNLELLASTLSEKCDDDEFVVEGERVEAIQREVLKIQGTLSRMQTMVLEGKYGTREYLPGRLMTDLGDVAAGAEAVAGAPGEAGSSNGDRSERQKGGPKPLGGTRVLVVDDDLGVCHSLRDVLREERCQVWTATDGREALDILHRQAVDIVVSDVVMPDMDGYDLYMELKRERPELPVVLMTAYYFDKDHVIKRSRMEGLEQVIFKKPINPARLKTILSDALAERAPAPAPGSAAPAPRPRA